VRQKLHSLILLAVTTFVGSAARGAAAPGVGPADFNDARLQSGRAMYDLQRYLEAIDQFRVAAFGYLDRPPQLSEALARLILAQNAAGRTDDVKVSVLRYVDLQRRFPSYPPTGLEPERQEEFRAVLLKQVPENTLAGIPAFSGLVETEEQKVARLAPAQRRTALEASARRDPQNVAWPIALARDDMQKSDYKGAEKWAQKALAIDGTNPEARILSARARILRGELSQGCSDLSAVPAAWFDQRPELYADVFVCHVEMNDPAGAEAAAAKIPSNLASRPDVVRAQQKLSTQTTPKQAATSSTASTVAPASRTSTSMATNSPKNPAPPAAPQSTTTTTTTTVSAGSPASTAQRPPAPAPTPDAAASAARSRDVLIQSRRLVVAGRAVDAQQLLSGALQTDPGNRELRLALLEAACLARAYNEAAYQVQLVSPFGENEAPSMFYAAVVLYETGKTDEARGLLKRAVPRVSGPLVDEYSRKILGP
jgi:tetratricopeptide (TPR) repeat protein